MSKRALKFELQVFFEPEDPGGSLDDAPSIQEALFVAGVSKGFIGKRYVAGSAVTLLARDMGGPLLRFGSGGLSGAMCVDLATGHVIENINVPGSGSTFVNTSIGQFAGVVKALTDRFPYCNQGAPYEEID